MNAVIDKIWIFILLYGAFEVYTMYEAHQEVMTGLESSIPRVQSQITRAQKEKRQIKSYLRDIEEAKKNIELVALEVEKLQKKLPESIKDAENLNLIRDIAEGLNIKSIYLSPSIEENKGFYFTKRYEFKGTGTFLQLLILLEKIGSSERLLNIRKVDFKKSDKPQRGRFQLTNAQVIVEAYRYNPDHKEDRGIDNIQKEFVKQQAEKKKRARMKRKRERRKKKKK